VMVPAASVEGQLLDDQGKPIAGQHLSVKGEQTWPSSSVLAFPKTDAQGKFQINVLPAGLPIWFEYGDAATSRFTLEPERHSVYLKFSPAGDNGKSTLRLSRGVIDSNEN
jgi:hypothetical protein